MVMFRAQNRSPQTGPEMCYMFQNSSSRSTKAQWHGAVTRLLFHWADFLEGLLLDMPCQWSAHLASLNLLVALVHQPLSNRAADDTLR